MGCSAPGEQELGKKLRRLVSDISEDKGKAEEVTGKNSVSPVYEVNTHHVFCH